MVVFPSLNIINANQSQTTLSFLNPSVFLRSLYISPTARYYPRTVNARCSLSSAFFIVFFQWIWHPTRASEWLIHVLMVFSSPRASLFSITRLFPPKHTPPPPYGAYRFCCGCLASGASVAHWWLTLSIVATVIKKESSARHKRNLIRRTSWPPPRASRIVTYKKDDFCVDLVGGGGRLQIRGCCQDEMGFGGGGRGRYSIYAIYVARCLQRSGWIGLICLLASHPVSCGCVENKYKIQHKPNPESWVVRCEMIVTLVLGLVRCSERDKWVLSVCPARSRVWWAKVLFIWWWLGWKWEWALEGAYVFSGAIVTPTPGA